MGGNQSNSQKAETFQPEENKENHRHRVGQADKFEPINENFCFRYGTETEFWLLLELFEKQSIIPADELYKWLAEQLGDSTSMIVGVQYLDEQFTNAPKQFLVYCRNCETLQFAFECLSSEELSRRSICKISSSHPCHQPETELLTDVYSLLSTSTSHSVAVKERFNVSDQSKYVLSQPGEEPCDKSMMLEHYHQTSLGENQDQVIPNDKYKNAECTSLKSKEGSSVMIASSDASSDDVIGAGYSNHKKLPGKKNVTDFNPPMVNTPVDRSGNWNGSWNEDFADRIYTENVECNKETSLFTNNPSLNEKGRKRDCVSSLKTNSAVVANNAPPSTKCFSVNDLNSDKLISKRNYTLDNVTEKTNIKMQRKKTQTSCSRSRQGMMQHPPLQTSSFRPGMMQQMPLQTSLSRPGMMQQMPLQTGSSRPGMMQHPPLQTGSSRPGMMQHPPLQTGFSRPGMMRHRPLQTGSSRPGIMQHPPLQTGSSRPGMMHHMPLQTGSSRPGMMHHMPLQTGSSRPGMMHHMPLQTGSSRPGMMHHMPLQTGSSRPGMMHHMPLQTSSSRPGMMQQMPLQHTYSQEQVQASDFFRKPKCDNEFKQSDLSNKVPSERKKRSEEAKPSKFSEEYVLSCNPLQAEIIGDNKFSKVQCHLQDNERYLENQKLPEKEKDWEENVKRILQQQLSQKHHQQPPNQQQQQYLSGQQPEYSSDQPQQHQKLKMPSNNHIVQFDGFPRDCNEENILRFINEQCDSVEILKVVQIEKECFVKLNSQSDCQKLHEAMRKSSYNGVKIKPFWKRLPKETNQDRPYVVVNNLDQKFKQKDVQNVFKNCQGFVDVTRQVKDSYARVYFDSVDSAGKAIDQRNKLCLGGKSLEVTAAIGITEELEWRKLECQRVEYLKKLHERKEALLKQNDKKLKDLEDRTPDLSRREKYMPLEEFDRLKEARKTYKGKKQELEEQKNEFENKYCQLLESFNKQIEDYHSVNYRKGIEDVLKTHKNITEREFRKFEASLPIYAKRTEILKRINCGQVVVLVGETGSGKSTQLAQYLAEENLNERKKVVVTQPRKIAAISLAKRVSEEFGCEIGEEVGYHVGLDKKIKNKTIIKFVTDRILLNEVLKGDDVVKQYSYIVIDEAHERSIHTDLLVAMLKKQLAKFPLLKLIVTSATLNTDIFRQYFGNCPLVTVPGRTFPVERVYMKERPTDYVGGVYEKIVEVCQSKEQGDILVFLTQQNEIEKTCDKLEQRLGTGNIILPLHGKLQSDEQQKVFETTPKGKRKIVVATNSAETSLTIDGIRIVVDSGMVKEPSFDPARNMTTLEVKLVSQSSAVQRSGRAGRTEPGKCYCLYTYEDYENMAKNTKPEILKMHLGMAVLQLLSLGVTDIQQFDFVQSPPADALTKAIESLKMLRALDPDGTLNDLGKEMLLLPTEPQLSKALLEGLDRGCGNEIIIAAALMSSGHDVFYRGNLEIRNECAIQKQEFCQTSGDLLSAIDVYKKWSEKSKKEQVAWCKENALNSKLLRAARETFREIREALSHLRDRGINLDVTAENIQESLIKSLLTGYFENIAWSFGHDRLGYMVVSSNHTNQKARIHPSSVLASLGYQPDWVLYQQLKSSNDQVFLLNITPVHYEWLAEVAMHMLQYIDEDAIDKSRVIRQRFHPVGPEMVKAVIGFQGSTLKQIEASVTEKYSVFCAVECSVDKGMVDVYTSKDSLHYASQLVNDVIQRRRHELDGYSEVVISNVGGLKMLVSNNLQTKLILQPRTSCKFEVFVDTIDPSEKVESMTVLEMLKDAGKILHFATTTKPGSEGNFKWGNVTYISTDEAEKARKFLNFVDPLDLPYNVQKIKLSPIRVERATSQDNTQPSGIKVLVSWFPLPASGRAYIKCKSREVTDMIVQNLDCVLAPVESLKPKIFVKKDSGDICIHVRETADEFTVRKQLESCCTISQIENISKISVPSKQSKIDPEEEKEKLIEVLKDFGPVRILKPWIANSQKVLAYAIFEDLNSAEKTVLELNERNGVIGARAMYLEFAKKVEVMCDGRIFEKIRKEIEALKKDDVTISNEQCQRRRKIIVTGDDPKVVQDIGVTISSLVAPEIVLIEDAETAEILSSGYGRSKIKQIQKQTNAIIYTNNFGRRIQITANSKSKRQARVQIEKLIKDLRKTRHSEIDLRHSDRPVGAIREILKHFGKDLNKLVEGEDCQASMEIRRRKLVLHGSKEAVNKVQNKVEEFLQTLPNSQRETANLVNECPVCFGEVEDPYLLTLCGHAYCFACITQYLNNVFDSVKSADMFPQKCMCEKCEYYAIKEDYSKLLDVDQIEKLYRISLECFMIGNPNIKPCPTPDCSWIYEITADPNVFTCPECNTQTCKKCGDSGHEKFDTCEAFKASKGISRSDQQLKEWAKGANTRECPKCSVMIEKNSGCEHMHCTQCKAHICWQCGKFFSTSEQCYEHIPFCDSLK
ncbi:ATP-dependent RNA helicase DEAH12, chloroplastic-like [Dendronephthya gigantea]|uniref:ATP-dependent RNA helicase DEAH12, chloroplastic-like n=1 Tax=Dendronephthya gigantea TaxID=151771 RepID=UPI00106D7741|nr:ATP-dependent RNA helicase DEAH12, chloroplastic-like [Dendronephthya gigantea]XP_028412749.1 ATP-dependent RNA helicase DEAH12, chloroplastic-like [Dendronephthya gigantea]